MAARKAAADSADGQDDAARQKAWELAQQKGKAKATVQ
jgi:hypothetical protein